MTLENLGWFLLGAGAMFLGCTLAAVIPHATNHMKNKRKFREYIEGLKKVSDQLAQAQDNSFKEISELIFRDKDGQLCTVKIVVDHKLNEKMSEDDIERMRQMIESGESAGKMADLISSAQAMHTEEEMKQVEQFVFSGHAASQMRAGGVELDEVVRRMLKASGRII